MTTHPTSIDAGLTDNEWTVPGADVVPDLLSGPAKPVAPRTPSGNCQAIGEKVKPRQIQRCAAEYGFGAERITRLLHRLRGTTFALRWAHRRTHAATGTVWPIEDQLNELQPICSAHLVSTGNTCGAPAVAIADVHAIDGCNQIGLSPDGDFVATLCQNCLSDVQWLMSKYVGHMRETASRCGIRPVCATCGRSTQYLRSVLAVRPIGPVGLAS